ncbi:MAG: HAD family hydrolase [Flaviflexus sp.]|nr:HAD family hydrolase [Flaviflexus sp.]
MSTPHNISNPVPGARTSAGSTPPRSGTSLPFTPRHLVFDVDGTLTGADSRIAGPTLEALARARAAGYELTIATGRTAPAALQILSDAGVDGWVVGAGGSVVHDGREIRHVETMDEQMVVGLIEAGRERGLEVLIYDAEDVYVEFDPADLPEVMHTSNAYRPFYRTTFSSLDLTRIVKVMYGSPDASEIDRALAELPARFPGLVRCHENFAETPAPTATKWHGLEVMFDQRGLAAENGLGVGDSQNDASWLPRMGIALAAPEADKELAAACHGILPASDYPVARLIDSLPGVAG